MEYQIRRKKIFVEDNSVVTTNSYISKYGLFFVTWVNFLSVPYASGLNDEMYFKKKKKSYIQIFAFIT